MNIAEINIPLSNFTNSFKFKTSQLDISVNNIDPNTQYCVDILNWNDTFDIPFSKTLVNSNNNYNESSLCHNVLVQYMDKIFNLPEMYKLIGNKLELKDEFNKIDISLNILLRNKLLESGGSISNIKTTSSNNIIYDCLYTILSSNTPERITDLFTPNRDITQWLSIPFIVGDTISFNITYVNFINNFTFYNNNTIPDIEYLFKIHLT